MKKNLILSIVSLCLAFMVTFLVLFAWLTTNATTKASILNVHVNGVQCDVSLETYQNNSWVELDDLSFDNLEPGDVIYFRLKVDSEVPVRVNANPDSFTSEAIGGADGIVVDLTNMELTYQGVSIFNIEDDYTVLIDNQVVYNINAVTGAITIVDDYKIGNAMNTYNLGTSVTGKPSIEGLTGNALGSLIFDSGVSLSSGISYAYFAIEYEDYDSSSSTLKEFSSNNFFVYQLLTITALNVFVS